MFQHKSRRIIGSASAIAALMLSMAYTSGGAQASTGSTGGDGLGTPQYATDQSAANFSANATTLPYFRSQFTDPTNGVTYPYTMVGTNPANGNATTVIPTEIIPFSFTFTVSADPSVHTLNGADEVANTKASPVFQSSDVGAAADATASAPPSFAVGRTVNEPSDVTQVGDAIYRAQWGMTGSNYHVLLGQPTVLPTQSFVVPQNLGQIVVGSRSGARIGLLDYHWFSNRLTQTINSMHIDPHTLPIILVHNTFLYLNHNPGNCCILGYHGATTSLNGAGHQQVQTYMFASYSTQGIFGAHPGDKGVSYIADIHALSHEVQEWYDDPFVNNKVDPWLTPTAPQYGCTGYLETGDPVVGYGFKISMSNGITYHPEDETHFSWFARESPSRAEQGYYTYLNNFPSVAQGC